MSHFISLHQIYGNRLRRFIFLLYAKQDSIEQSKGDNSISMQHNIEK